MAPSNSGQEVFNLTHLSDTQEVHDEQEWMFRKHHTISTDRTEKSTYEQDIVRAAIGYGETQQFPVTSVPSENSLPPLKRQRIDPPALNPNPPEVIGSNVRPFQGIHDQQMPVNTDAAAEQMIAASGIDPRKLNSAQFQNFANAPTAAQQKSINTFVQTLQWHHDNKPGNKQMPNVVGYRDQGSPMLAQAPGGTVLTGSYNPNETNQLGRIRAGNLHAGAAGSGSIDPSDGQRQLILLEQRHRQRLQMARTQEPVRSSLNNSNRNKADGFIPPPEKSHSEVYTNHSAETLLRRVQLLEQENKKLKEMSLENAKTPIWQAFHCIIKQNHEHHIHHSAFSDNQPSRSFFLREPSWEVSGDHVNLRGHAPIANTTGYLKQRPNVVFAVYNYYNPNHRKSEAIDAAKKSSEIPAPQPVWQTIQITSSDLIEATASFLHQQPEFETEFPKMTLHSPMPAPYLWWYRYRGRTGIESLKVRHKELIALLTNWIDENYAGLYAEADSQISNGLISSTSMDFLFRPGDVVVSGAATDPKAYLITSYPKRTDKRQPWHSDPTDESDDDEEGPFNNHKKMSWKVESWSYSYGGSFHKARHEIEIELDINSAESEACISDLNVIPLRHLDRSIHQRLEMGGKTFWMIRKRKLVSYQESSRENSHTLLQRYMVDTNTHKILHPKSYENRDNEYDYISDMPKEIFQKDEHPAEPDLLLFPNQIVGFNLRSKKWRDLKVDYIQEVAWNKTSFDHLVLPNATKELIEALITNQLAAEKATDVIANKGNGLIMLLHGGPGTGKTFTAESVAEMAEKPLYPVTCGDIGTKPDDVEGYLESVFHLGKLWGCVVLLDEAEVFLEQRTLNDLERNALVSVFLRVLEYYDGILILTSNRVGTFDEAFKSRIQLALYYQPLGKDERKKIWKNFFNRLEGLGEDQIDYRDIDRHIPEISAFEINGRQIRNSITTARQLAQFKKKTLNYDNLKHAIEVTSEFDKYLKDLNKGITHDEIAREEGYR